MTDPERISLMVSADAGLARLVRMTAANVAMLSSMSVDRVEDIKMAAEEAFIYACGTSAGSDLKISFIADAEHVEMVFTLEDVPAYAEATEDDPAAAYADLIIGAVCDSYEKRESPASLVMSLKADI